VEEGQSASGGGDGAREAVAEAGLFSGCGCEEEGLCCDQDDKFERRRALRVLHGDAKLGAG